MSIETARPAHGQMTIKKLKAPESRAGNVGTFTHFLLAAVLIVFLGSSCSKDGNGNFTYGPFGNEINNALTFEYADGTEITMGEHYAICCGIWEPGYIDKNTLKIFFFDPTWKRSFWKLFIIVDEVHADSTYSLPTVSLPIRMFFVDVDTANELSSSESESSGTITINSLDCGPPVRISLTIDASIASEYGDMPSVDVKGSFDCKIIYNPAAFDCDFSL